MKPLVHHTPLPSAGPTIVEAVKQSGTAETVWSNVMPMRWTVSAINVLMIQCQVCVCVCVCVCLCVCVCTCGYVGVGLCVYM